MSGPQRLCFGCVNHISRFEGDGGRTFLCRARPGLVLGGLNLIEDDEPHEIDNCWTPLATGRDA